MKAKIIIGLITLTILLSFAKGQVFRRVFEFPDVGSAIDVNGLDPNAIPDDSIYKKHFGDQDWGDLSVSSNSVTFDANTVAAAELAAGDYGDLTISAAGVITLDPNTVAASELAAGDYGVISISAAGAITIDANAIELSDFGFGVAAGDIIYYTGTSFAILDANEPNDILTINDSNLPVWQQIEIHSESIYITNIYKGNTKIITITDEELIAMLGAWGVVIGAESASVDTKLTIVEDTSGAPLYIEMIADANEDNSDRWRWKIEDSGDFILESYATGTWTEVDWFGLVGTDPDVDTVGMLGTDTDGANEPNDVVLRTPGANGDEQYALAQVRKVLTIPISDPNNLAGWTGRTNISQPVWMNDTGMTFHITDVNCYSDTDDYTCGLYESASETDLSDDNDSEITTFTCSTDGTEGYIDTGTSISDAVIATGHFIIFESTAEANGIIIKVGGYFDADVD